MTSKLPTQIVIALIQLKIEYMVQKERSKNVACMHFSIRLCGIIYDIGNFLAGGLKAAENQMEIDALMRVIWKFKKKS